MKAVKALGTAFGVLALVLVSQPIQAADSGIGTWVRHLDPASPQGKTGQQLTMTVEAWGNGGRKLTYRMSPPAAAEPVVTVESPMDGTDAPVLVNGKPSGETMGIRRMDGRHTVTVLKWDGKPFGVSKAALSADLKTLTVDTEITLTAEGRQPGKATEIWVRK